jgi:hypothetical protein
MPPVDESGLGALTYIISQPPLGRAGALWAGAASTTVIGRTSGQSVGELRGARKIQREGMPAQSFYQGLPVSPRTLGGRRAFPMRIAVPVPALRDLHDR